MRSTRNTRFVPERLVEIPAVPVQDVIVDARLGAPPPPPPFLVPQAVRGPHQEIAMYAMYPEAREWGPARRDPENPYGRDAVQTALDLRDNRGPWPDDN